MTESVAKSSKVFWIGAVVLLAVVIASIGARIHMANKERGIEVKRERLVALSFYQFEQPRALANILLNNLDGEEKFFSQHLSGWRIINFGYLSCPDICPINLSLLNQLKTAWDEDSQQPPFDVVHVTFDPTRDTPDLLKRYLTFMNPNFYGLTGEVNKIRQLAQQLNITFLYETPNEYGDYFISHSDSMALINPEGQYVGLFKGPYDVMNMTKALKILLAD
jgi:protein SCO1/2